MRSNSENSGTVDELESDKISLTRGGEGEGQKMDDNGGMLELNDAEDVEQVIGGDGEGGGGMTVSQGKAPGLVDDDGDDVEWGTNEEDSASNKDWKTGLVLEDKDGSDKEGMERC